MPQANAHPTTVGTVAPLTANQAQHADTAREDLAVWLDRIERICCAAPDGVLLPRKRVGSYNAVRYGMACARHDLGVLAALLARVEPILRDLAQFAEEGYAWPDMSELAAQLESLGLRAQDVLTFMHARTDDECAADTVS